MNRPFDGFLHAGGMLPAFLAIVCSQTTAQTTVTVPCARDNTLYESATGALSSGAGTAIFAGRTAQAAESKRRALVFFDVAAVVPAGSRIVSAALTIQVVRSRTLTALDFTGHRVLQSWGEGTSVAGNGGGGGALPTTNDVTWLHRFSPATLWNTAGGDFAATPSFTISTPAFGPATASPSAAALADVQSWLDNPTQNFGWLLKDGETTGMTARSIDSRETALGTRPALVITYLTNGQSTPFGQGCLVNGQPFTQAWVGAPIGGTTVQWTESNGPPGAVAANLIALSFNPAGFPLLPQCSLYLPFGGLIVTQSIVVLNPGGGASVFVNLPAGFPGVQFVTQAAALDNSPAGFLLSNAVIALLQ